MIARNMLRATFARWSDRAIAALMLLLALAALRAGLADRPWQTAAWGSLGAATAIGIGAARLIATRLAFHAFDGVLAADALHPRARRRYAVAWHGVALAMLAAATLVARPALLLVAVPAYLAGALLAALAGGGGPMTRAAGLAWREREIRAWSHRPRAGLLAATVLLLALLPARALDANVLFALVGSAAAAIGLLLTGVDDALVRFMAMTGHGSWRIVARHAGGVAAFLAVAAPGCWLVLGPGAAGIVAAAGAAILLLLALRILAYRLHARRFADVVVVILAGSLVLVAIALPVALPVIAPGVLWHLHRRARAKTWLLA